MASSRLQFYGSSHASSDFGLVRHRSPGVVATLSSITRAIAAMYRRDLHRRVVAQLDDHLLADIGIDRNIARMEAARAPWDPLLPR